MPEGMEVEFITEELTVNVRGPKALVKKMTAANVSATVDFANAEAGTSTFKVNVVMGDGFRSVGTMGTYTVSATLTETDEKGSNK